MKNFEKTIKDLYHDLRKRRLLPVVAILMVAIIVVPMALGSGSPQVAPQTELAVGIEPLADTQPVVLPTTPELRNFHKRLDEYDKKNPFHQPEAPVVKASGSSSSGTDATASAIDASAATSTATSTGTAASSSTADTGTTTIPADPGTTTPTDTGTAATPADTGTKNPGGTGTSGSSGSRSDPNPTDILSHQIDVSAGPVGKEKDLTGVESLDFLPDVKHPVLQYVSGSPNGLKASFVVSSKVVRVVGDGRCSPSPADCQFLQLKVGQAERLDYGTDNGLYRVKLLGITQILNPLKKLSAAAGDVSGRISFSAGLSG